MTHRIIRLPAVKERTGKSRTSIYEAIANGSFPRQISLGGRAVGWLEEEIEQWVAGCVRASRPYSPYEIDNHP
jgi:prophage regulatory protein